MTALCWACQRDIETAVRHSIYGEWFCTSCDKKVREFLHGLRRETPPPARGGPEGSE